jgi:hypothetical protein
MRGPSFGVLFGRGREQEIDDGYDREAHILQSLGIGFQEIELDAVVHENAEQALEHLPPGRGRAWLYRGWMLPEEDYTSLYEAMLERGDRLVVHPSELAAAAYLPEWAPLLGERTPRSVWTEGEDIQEAWEAAQELGPPPWLIKDHLKSARQMWERACYVPAGADQEAFTSICQGLLDFHEDRFQRGFVIRQFVQLQRLPYVAQGHPVFDEHRIVFWKGRPVAHAPYHDVEVEPLRSVPFPELGKLVSSPFFTADLGRLEGGGFTVIELNDGGCSGLPDQLDVWALYEAMLRDPP